MTFDRWLRDAGRAGSWVPATVDAGWPLGGLDLEAEEGRLFSGLSKGSSRRGGRIADMLVGRCTAGAVAGRDVLCVMTLSGGAGRRSYVRCGERNIPSLESGADACSVWTFVWNGDA